jgi:hypothetical protein
VTPSYSFTPVNEFQRLVLPPSTAVWPFLRGTATFSASEQLPPLPSLTV